MMFTQRFLKDKRGVKLAPSERAALENAISDVRDIPARRTLIRAGREVEASTLLVEGIMSRYIDDRDGLRQLVAVHVPGDFVDLHAFPLKVLEHDVATMTPCKVAIIPHIALEAVLAEFPAMSRKLWFATLIDAAIHRAWLFRMGRLDAVGKMAHFLCETNARLVSAGLSDGRRFALDLTQADLAEICGLTTVHINRVLRQLRNEGLCVFRASMVELFDPEGLSKRGQFNDGYLYNERTATAVSML